MYNSVAGAGSNLGAGSAQRGMTTSQQTLQAGTGALGTNSSNQPNDGPHSNATAAPAFSLTKIHVHNEHFSKQDLVLDPKLLPNVKPGDLFEIYDPTLPKDSTKKLIIQWAGPDKDTPSRTPVQVSLATNIAKIFGISSRQDVIIQKADPNRYAAKYVEVTFRDQYVGRSDMWRLRTSLVGTCVYEAKKILYLGCIRVQVKEIYVGNQSVPSGYITADTRIIFRSESAKYFIFIQMSREMWEFDEDGEIFFERVIFGFLPNLFARWRGKRDGKSEHETPANHVVSIVLFSRIFYQEEEEARFKIDGYPGGQSGLQKDEEGRFYQDFYKVVVDWEARMDWTSAIVPLKEEVMRYQRDILLRPSGKYEILSGENSFAFEGNVLESINLALNSLDKHYVDRDLERTGLSIVMITPGSGMFDVDKKLLRLTTERMISGGIGLDMVCLSKIPAHIVPLFRWKGPLADSSGLTSVNNGSGPSPSNMSFGNNSGPTSMNRSSSAFARPTSRPPSIKESSADTRPTTPWTRAFKSSTSNPLPEVQLDMSDPLYYDAPPMFPSSACKTYYMMPHWVDCMFYVGSRKPNPQKFYTRCKMYELQMMGIMEHEISSISIPYLNESYNSQYPSNFGKRLHSSDALGSRGQSASTTDFEKHDDDVFADKNSQLAAEIRQLSMSTTSRGMIRDAVSLDNLESGGKNANAGRRMEGYLEKPNYHTVSGHKVTSELSRSLPRAWNTSMVMATSVIPENPTLRDLATAPNRVSFSLKSANGFLEESRAAKQVEKSPSDDYDGQNGNGQKGTDDGAGDDGNYGRTSQANIDIKPKSGHIRASTDDDPGFLSSSTVKPIYIRNYRALQDETTSEVSGADSVNTGSFSSEKGHRTFVSNPSGPGGRIIQTRQRSKQTDINPCNPPKTVIRMTSHLRRWQHAFPRARERSASVNLIRSEVYTDGLSNTEAWRGLMSPASLPLTTDYFPSKEELQDLYSEYIHTISPSEDGYAENDKARRIKATNLMSELIYHRLAQGFQLIVDSSSKTQKLDLITSGVETTGGSSGKRAVDAEEEAYAHEFPCKDTGECTNGPGSSKDRACFLSMGQQVHRLSIDVAHGNVEVKRYERRLGYKPESVKYQCVIWAKKLPGYLPRDLTFSYPLLSHYQWNYLDHLVSGYQEELTEDLLYWRARFILIPLETITLTNMTAVAGEHLDEEEMRLSGFQRFLELFQKARFVDPQDPGSASKKQDTSVKVLPITCSFAAWAQTELNKKELDASPSLGSQSLSTAEPEKLNRNSKIQAIATAIQNPLTGVKLQDRRWHLRVYNSVFLGNEVVDWLIHNFVDLDTREEATEFGKKLFDKGLFIHCLGKHHFLDGHYFYQFSGEYAPSGKQARGWFRNTTQSLTRRDVDLEKLRENHDQSAERQSRPSLKAAASSTSGSTTTLGSVLGGSGVTQSTAPGGTSQPSTNGAPPPFRERMEMLRKMAPKKVDMSKRMTIDVDPSKKSSRRETAILHYDLAHNIKHCYHFHLHWLGCTARLIEDLLQSWGRTAERCGLRLVEAPIEQDSQGRAFNPFESPVPIKLALRPPLTKGFYKPASPLDPQTEPVQVPQLHFFTELVKQHGFILDTESDELYPPAEQLNYSYRKAAFKNIQYVHRTGVAFIQIAYNGPSEFLWVTNRLLTSHSAPNEHPRSEWDRTKAGGSGQDSLSGAGSSNNKSSSSGLPSPDNLLAKFEAVCYDKEALSKIWSEISSHLETVSGIQDILEDVPDESVVGVMPSLAAPRRNSEAHIDSLDPSNTSSSNDSDESKSPDVDDDATTPSENTTTRTTPVPTIRIELDPASHEEDLQQARAQAQAQAQADDAESQAPAQTQIQQTNSQAPSDSQTHSEQDPLAPEEQQDQNADKELSSANGSPVVEAEPASTIVNSPTTTPRRSVDHRSDGPADRFIADQKLP
ncbi:DEP domain-containing protein 5 [Entomortierella parvispora]|uniref:Vacuolar membrane-associated protein IML1 n=1 Tax=Entomortierella parvispora TaxID=205924 RepID=A0A9P3M297_9FUNG|nr:DEP domain-containing protein 5 [Entomortierella parvispora]